MSEYMLVNYENAFDENGDLLETSEKIYERYKSQIEDRKISIEGLENIVAYFKDGIDMKMKKFKFHIKMIYVAIVSIKYLSDEGNSDIGKIGDILSNILALSSDWSFKKEYDDLINQGKIGFYNIPKLCEEVYNDILIDSAYGEDGYMLPYVEEEFKPEHLLDLKYHLDHFREWNKGDKEFEDVLNKELWRYI